MNIRKIAGDVGVAFVSQGVSLIVSAATSLMVPKVLGVEGFGYWQLFLFYASYSGVFALGLNDGVYLQLGGTPRDQADLGSLNARFRTGVVYEAALALAAVAFLSIASSSAERTFVLACTAAYVIVANAAGFLGYAFQAFGETRLFSRSVLVARTVFLVAMLPMFALGIGDFRPFVIAYVVSQTMGLLWCMLKACDLLIAPMPGLTTIIREACESIKVGSKLLLANLSSMLILGSVRQAVDMRWGIKAFGQLSLSLSLVNFALSFVGQVGMVLFPALRRASKDELALVFEKIHVGLALALPVSYIVVLPLAWLIAKWLPAYAEGITYIVWLMPLLVFDGQMSLLGSTYLKVLHGETRLLLLNASAVAVSVVGTGIGVALLGSMSFAIGSAVTAIILRSLVAEWLVSRMLDSDAGLALSVGEVLVTASFLVLCATLPSTMALVCYVVVYALYLLLFRKKLRWLLAGIGISG